MPESGRMGGGGGAGHSMRHARCKCATSPSRRSVVASIEYTALRKLTASRFATRSADADDAESNRYAADMPVSALLQAKASSLHLYRRHAPLSPLQVYA